MLNKYINYILVGLLLVIFVQGFLTVPSGVSENEVQWRLKYQALETKTKALLKKDKELEAKYENIEEHIPVDSLMVWDADRLKRDSLRSVLNPS